MMARIVNLGGLVQSRVEDYQRILHKDLLKQLAASTQASTDVAEKAQSLVSDTGARLGGLIETLRDDLQAEVQDRLAVSEKRLESQTQQIGKNLEQAQSLAHKAETQRIEENIQQGQQALRKAVEGKADNYQRLLREEMSAFKAEIQRDLVQQEQAIDRRLTDFLNKQNAMVQNLSQQIDSFNRASQAQSADLQITNTKLSEFAAAFDAQKETEVRQLLALTGGVTELRLLLTKAEAKIGSQEGAITALSQTSQDTAKRLDQTLEKLKKSIITGGILR
jgi:chromosome segregation ATPase